MPTHNNADPENVCACNLTWKVESKWLHVGVGIDKIGGKLKFDISIHLMIINLKYLKSIKRFQCITGLVGIANQSALPLPKLIMLVYLYNIQFRFSI